MQPAMCSGKSMRGRSREGKSEALTGSKRPALIESTTQSGRTKGVGSLKGARNEWLEKRGY